MPAPFAWWRLWRRLWRRDRLRLALRPVTLGVYLRAERAERSVAAAEYRRRLEQYAWDDSDQATPRPEDLTPVQRAGLWRLAWTRVLDETVEGADRLQGRLDTPERLQEAAEGALAVVRGVVARAWNEAEAAAQRVEDHLDHGRKASTGPVDLLDLLETAVASRQPADAAALLAMDAGDALAWVAAHGIVADHLADLRADGPDD